jgi:hypothetical protein
MLRGSSFTIEGAAPDVEPMAMHKFLRGRHPMDLYVRGSYLAAVERVAASQPFLSWTTDSRSGMIVRPRTHE